MYFFFLINLWDSFICFVFNIVYFSLGNDIIRMVTHLEIKENEIDEIVEIVNICCSIVMEMGVEDGKDGKEEEYGSWNTNWNMLVDLKYEKLRCFELLMRKEINFIFLCVSLV